MQTKTRILNKATELFHGLGIHAVSNDEIAKALGISKATIYKHFEKKELLVDAVVEAELSDHLNHLSQLMTQTRNVIQLVGQVWDYLERVRRGTNINFIRDIERSFDCSNQQLRSFASDLRSRIFQPAVKRGIMEGHFRPDTDEVLVSEIWLAMNQWNTTLEHGSNAVKHHFIRGLLTEAGFKLYESYAAK